MPLLTLLLALASADAKASPEAMKKLEPAFGGTIVSVYDNGKKGHLNLAKDGTYRYRGRTNKPSSGVWDMKNESTICLHQKKPIGIGSYCTPIPSGKTWRTKAAGGEMVTVHVEGGKG